MNKPILEDLIISEVNHFQEILTLVDNLNSDITISNTPCPPINTIHEEPFKLYFTKPKKEVEIVLTNPGDIQIKPKVDGKLIDPFENIAKDSLSFEEIEHGNQAKIDKLLNNNFNGKDMPSGLSKGQRQRRNRKARKELNKIFDSAVEYETNKRNDYITPKPTPK